MRTEREFPCPFCGGTDIRFDRHPPAKSGLHQGEEIWSMCCYQCGATFPNMYSREKLAEKWNRRALLAAGAEPVKPFCFVRTVNGEIDWGEDCLGKDEDIADGYDSAEGYAATPLFAAPPQQEWIAVSERLPEGNDAICCLVWCAETEDFPAGPSTAMYDDGEWIHRQDNGCWEPGEITHWQPQPSAPLPPLAAGGKV